MHRSVVHKYILIFAVVHIHIMNCAFASKTMIGLCTGIPSRPAHVAEDAETLIFKLHGQLLRILSAKVGLPFLGLVDAMRYYCKAGLFDSKMHRKPRELDISLNWVR